MKIVDCFTFYNELTMLKFRLEYLYDTVDHFVLVEATRTHVGNPKPLFFEQNKSMFAKYLDKIVHIVVSDMPMPVVAQTQTKVMYTLRRENYQRQCIRRGIQSLALKNDDLIIISDCDEIPDRNTIKNKKIDKLYALEQDLYYYDLTYQQKEKWTQSRICNYQTYKTINDPQLIRMTHCECISNGGWHFSYFGNTDFIVNKIRNFCHYNWFENLTTDEIKERIQSGKFLIDLNFIELIKIPIEKNTYLPPGYEILLTMT